MVRPRCTTRNRGVHREKDQRRPTSGTGSAGCPSEIPGLQPVDARDVPATACRLHRQRAEFVEAGDRADGPCDPIALVESLLCASNPRGIPGIAYARQEHAMVVDFQHHYTPTELMERGAAGILRLDENGNPNYKFNPLLADLPAHVRMMDVAGIDLAVLFSGSGFDQPDIATCRL